jgi:RHS repeat-associated protein
LITGLFFLLSSISYSQTFSISGPTCVSAGSSQTYTISGSWTTGTTMSWSASGGVVSIPSSGTPKPQVTVTWNAGFTTGQVSLTTSNPSGSATLSISAQPALVAGTLTTPAAIAYNTSPSITGAVSSGGNCGATTYTYDWEQGSDNVNFTSTGIGGQNFAGTPILNNTYYRRKTIASGTGASGYSNSVLQAVSIQAGTITPSSITINSGTSPGLLTGSTPLGGSGTYGYLWYFSTNGGSTWTLISGAASKDYTPGILTASAYYKREVTSPNTPTTSSTAIVTVISSVTGVAPATNGSGSANLDMNWVKSTSFDPSGNIIGQQKSFFDKGGNLLQSQSKVFYRKDATTVLTHVFASQPVKDVYGRGVLNTMSAPIDYADFNYSSTFIQAADGSAYSYKNFDRYNPSGTETDKTNSPDPIGSQAVKGSLGWYYSVNNTWEPYTPTTNYPYARNTIYRDGTDNTKKAAQEGESFKMGSGQETGSFITPAFNELALYISARNQFFPTTAGAVPTSLQYQSIQTVSMDPNGAEGVQIMDRSGKVLMTARPGTGLSITNTITLKAQPYSVVIPTVPTVGGCSFGTQNILLTGSGKAFTVTSPGNVVRTFTGEASSLPIPFTATDWGSTITSDAPFSVVYNDMGTGCVPVATNQNSQSALSSAVQNYYFKIFANSTAVSITGSGTYTLTGLNTETATALIGGNSLNKGYYKLKVNTGTITLSYSNSYTDISYNFYNQLGQLIATITPEGVKKVIANGVTSYTSSTVPYTSLYEYNTKGQLIKSTTTDGGASKFVYRTDGKLRFSQNARQLANNAFSYTNYDQYGRPVESGEYTGTITFTNDLSAASTIKTILDDVTSTGGLTGGTQTDVVRTKYDVLDNSHGLAGYTQDAYNIRGGVSVTEKYSSIVNNAPVAANVISRSWYSYDEEGKVLWQIKYINSPNFGYKTVDLTYDNLGHVIKKVYQKSSPTEIFVHYYEYDPVNQNLWKIYTGTVDNGAKMLQATYTYYLHGGVKRVELATNLQGIDYTYTLQGALKAINNSNATADPGGDGAANGFGADAFGMVLDYFPSDYVNSRTAGIQAIKGVSTGAITPAITESYAGNIKAMSWFSKKPPALVLPELPLVYVYRYDAKYQFTESIWGNTLNFANTPASFTATAFNKESIYVPSTTTPAYDGNGNILNLQRTNTTGATTDNFAYNYNLNTNKLGSVVNTTTGITYGSYTYDQIGQMTIETTTDPTNQTKYLKYDVSGKVTLVARDAAFTQKVVEFVYDEMGKRIMKKNYSPVSPYLLQSVTYYAGGVVYTQPVTGGTTYGAATAQEYPIEGGSGRLGIYYRQSPVYAYQLTDHLGNVRAVIAFSGATPTVRMYTDYYPYGMTIATGGTNDYRYGYQGNYAEKDGETNWNAFELRMYNSRIARWLQYDPKNVGNSPYIGMNNDPVNNVDPDGGEGKTTIVDKYNRVLNVIEDGKTDIIRLNNVDYDDWSNCLTGKGSGDIFNEAAFSTGQRLSMHTLNTNDFMKTNDIAGGYLKPLYGNWVGGSKIPGFEDFTGQEIVQELNAQFVSESWALPELLAEGHLALNSHDGAFYDVKRSMTKSFVDEINTSVMWDANTVTTMRAVGNILFGKNMNSARAFYHSKLETWNLYMPYIGAYNQAGGGNGYNAGFPYYGEHEYSGAYIWMGFFGK